MSQLQFEISLGTATLVRFVGPLDVQLDNPLDDADGASGDLRLFDDDLDKYTDGETASAATTIKLNNVVGLKANQKILFEFGAYSQFSSTILIVDPALNTILIFDPTPQIVDSGTLVSVQLLPIILMSEYGTPVAGSDQYGYEGVIAGDHASLVTGQQIRLEMRFEGAAQQGALSVRKIAKGYVSGGS